MPQQKKKKPIDPEMRLILDELEQISQRIGYTVRYEKGDFEGGYCVLKDAMLVVINSRNDIEKRISIVSKCLKQIGINDIFIRPNIRKIIDTESAKPIEKTGSSPEDEIVAQKEDPAQ